MFRSKEEEIEIEIYTKLYRPYTIVWEDGKPYKKCQIWREDVIERLKYLHERLNKDIGSESASNRHLKEIKLWDKYLDTLDKSLKK
jgi:uncharacterized protein YegL